MVYVVHTNVLPTFSKAFWTFSKKFQPLRAVGTKVLKAAQEFLVVSGTYLIGIPCNFWNLFCPYMCLKNSLWKMHICEIMVS